MYFYVQKVGGVIAFLHVVLCALCAGFLTNYDMHSIHIYSFNICMILLVAKKRQFYLYWKLINYSIQKMFRKKI